MSTPAPSASSVHPTRQQLDELDALMQRMLALPVNSAEDEATGPERPAPTQAPVVAELPRPDELAVSRPPARLTPLPPTKAEGQRPGRSLPRPAEPASPSTSDPQPKAEPGPETPRRRLVRSSFSWRVRPFVWCNQAFDACTWPLGPAGRWLRGPDGRALVGWTGLALLMAVLAWGAYDWIGWTW